MVQRMGGWEASGAAVACGAGEAVCSPRCWFSTPRRVFFGKSPARFRWQRGRTQRPGPST